MDLGVTGRGGARRRTRRRHNRMYASRSGMETAPASNSSPSADPNAPTEMLKMLQVLYDNRVLNDEEYKSKKQTIVDMM